MLTITKMKNSVQVRRDWWPKLAQVGYAGCWNQSYNVAFPTMNAAKLVHIHTNAQTRVKSGNRPGRVCHSFWKPSFNINQTRLSSSSSVWFGASKCHLSCATLWICSCKYIQRYQFHLARLSCQSELSQTRQPNVCFFFLSNIHATICASELFSHDIFKWQKQISAADRWLVFVFLSSVQQKHNELSRQQSGDCNTFDTSSGEASDFTGDSSEEFKLPQRL